MTDSNPQGLNRREFTTRAALGATAISAFNIANKANAQDAPMKIGVIGTGGRGTGAVENAIQANSNIQLVAMHDALEDRVRNSYNRLSGNENLKENIKVTEDTMYWGVDGYKKVLEHDLDYVILATPPGYRPMHFEAVVEKGLNCFCEKPVATDPVGVRRFMAAAKKSEEKKLHITTGNQRRHQQEYVETVARIHDGALGEILVGRAYWCGGLPFARDRQAGQGDLEYQLRNWYNYCWICGDNIVEQHIHNLDVMNWVLQSTPISCIASGGRSWKPRIEKYGNIWDNFSCDYEYPNGIHVYSFSRHLNHSYNEVSEHVIGSNRSYRDGMSNCRDMGQGGRNPYVQEHVALQESITGDGPYWNQAVQVAEATMTTILGRMAAYTGKKLTWDEAYNSDLDIFPKDQSFDKAMPADPIPETPQP